MTTADSISTKIVDWLGRRTMLSMGTRNELHNLVAEEFAAVVPREQPVLSFGDDKDALEGQAAAILALLKERRSVGAMNHELAEISLKYTSRISDLRAQGYKVLCERQAGRTFRYRLAATDW